MGQISKTTKSNKHKDRRPKSEPNLRLQGTITEISACYPSTHQKQTTPALRLPIHTNR